jgi:NADPH:quinone reductase-like Zn-dependent oxidoreductase
MRAIVYDSYGGSEFLKLTDIEKPIPQKGQVLIEVKAIGLNPRDCNIRNGDLKIISGKAFPKLTGSDLSGIIVDCGAGVTNFKAGDEIFGYIEDVKSGGSAEYVVLPVQYLALKPKEISFDTAATLGCTYLTALQTLRDKCKVMPGSKVAIYGASGGVGVAAIQLAKYFGAVVTAVSNSSNENFCLSQGANSFVAYDKTDIFSSSDEYDVFFQVFSKQGSFYDKAKGILKHMGIYTCLIPDPRFLFKSLFARPYFKYILVKAKRADLDLLAKLAVERKITPYISNKFKLEQMKEAHDMINGGHVNGKIVITL